MIFLSLYQSVHPTGALWLPVCAVTVSISLAYMKYHKHQTSHPALMIIPKIILGLPLLSSLSPWVFLPLYSWKFNYKEEQDKAKLWSSQYLGLPRVVLSGTAQTHPNAHQLHNCPVPGGCSLRSSSHLLIQEKTVFTTSCAWDQLQKEFYLLSFSLDCQPARITNNVSHC